MDYKIIINADNGGTDIGVNANGVIEKEYNLLISNYIHNRLNELGITNSIIRSTDETLSINERLNRITNTYGDGNDVLVITNSINSNNNSGAEIIYPLRNTNALAKIIANQLETAGINVNKYYQQRLATDTTKDANEIIRNTNNNQTIVIEYGNLNNIEDATNIKNNWEKIAEAIVIAISDYINAEYLPKKNSKYYVVIKGDSLYKIANKFNTSIQAIKNINNLDSNSLSIGQILLIPEKSENEKIEYQTYTVKIGDSLYKIANNFNSSVSEIKSLNNLSSNLLSIGQILKIPNSTTQLTYTVKAGDSLYKIANNFNTSVNEIKSLNNLSSNLLSIGQILKIPNKKNYIT